MPWVRLEEDFAWHPKMVQVGPLGLAMQVAGLCYCNRYLTDGFIPTGAVSMLLDFAEIDHTHIDVNPLGIAGLLVEREVWGEAEGGFRIHDYDQFQPSREEVLSLREQRSAAGRRGGLARAQASAEANAKQTPGKGLSKPSSKTEAKSKPGPVPGSGSLSSEDQLRGDGKSRPRNAHRIPKDWAPSDDLIAKAREKYPHLNVREEAEACADWHAAKGTKYVDWDRVFWTWLRKGEQRRQERQPSTDSSSEDLPILNRHRMRR